MHSSELTFREHLIELLQRFRTILISVIIVTILVMVVPTSFDLNLFATGTLAYPTVTSSVIRIMLENFLPPGVDLLPISWFAPLEVYMIVSLMLGTIISLPLIAYELYKFVGPALYEHERKDLSLFVLSFTGLFSTGFTVGYVFVVPATIRVLLMFANILGLPPSYEFAELFWLIVISLLLCGLVLTFPIYLVLLVKAGIVATESISRNRKYIYPVILVAIALLDPEPSLVTESLIGIPLIILTEISLLIARRFEKQRLSSQ